MSTSLIRGANTALPPGTGRVLVSVGWRPGDVAGQPLEVDAVVIAVDVRGHVAAPDRLALFGELGQARRHHARHHRRRRAGRDRPLGRARRRRPRADRRRRLPRGRARPVLRRRARRAPAGRRRVVRCRAWAATSLQETSPVTAVVLGEALPARRRVEARAVGQGYRDGMAALARDVGVPV
ncbi:hypothetical protein GCM10025868_27840 [Angustibacter aerolatus]|uniref:TerD domain-containing protein n=1 Tax=Angustibacter aerolatus TaxID=1162965 RepID=A0ABQ6JJH6_9ACTN|nr:hypothetical protein GCM10025868_27840 [Angustibacter aerolatus]